jgi:hypothetical protein
MFVEWCSFLLVCACAVALGAVLGSSADLKVVRNLVIAGALMRIVGVLARHTMIFELYGGVSDAIDYYTTGQVIAEHFRALDFSIIGSGRWGEREWGTQAIRYASGLVLTVIGSSVRGGFLAFSLIAFIGLACMAVAFARANRAADKYRVMRWCVLALFFWPSLWFWPSSIGKEAVLLLAVGLVTIGYVGRSERIHWVPLVSGLTLAMSVRPHLAGVLAVSMCVAEWCAREWTLRRMFQSVAAGALMVWLVGVAFSLLGLSGARADGFETYVLQTAGQTNTGGSSFERSESLVSAVPMAFVNILARPFITEANNAMALASSVEMLALWGIIFTHRRTLGSVLRSWRMNRLVRFAMPFTLLYILMIGITFQNSGIIARQRTLVIPMVLLMIAAVPVAVTRRTSSAPRRRVWRHHAVEPTLTSVSRPI